MICGTIATYDEGIDASPLVSAIVKVDPGGPTSEVGLRLDDVTLTSDPDFEDTFSAPPPPNHEPYCRYPTVEVTYCRSSESEEGYLTVYVIWSQFSYDDSAKVYHWDLYFKAYRFQVDSGGIDFDPVQELGPFPVAPTQTLENELQPDLALMLNGDLLLVYIRTPSVTFIEAHVMAMRADYNEDPQGWPIPLLPYVISEAPGALPTKRQISPSVDVGRVRSLGSGYGLTAVRVWFLEIWDGPIREPEPYHVQYAWWDALDDVVDPLNVHSLTSGDDNANALAKVDIAPPTPLSTKPEPWPPPLRQAVIAWTHFDYYVTGSPGNWVRHFVDPRIQMTVTPDTTEPFDEVPIVFGIAPYVTCYERHHEEQDQWFGVSFYEADTGGELDEWAWDFTRIQSYSYDELADIEFRYETWIDYQPAYWELPSPFTGSTLCLRRPDRDDVGDPPEPRLDRFGAAMIQETIDGTTVWVGEGTIW